MTNHQNSMKQDAVNMQQDNVNHVTEQEHIGIQEAVDGMMAMCKLVYDAGIKMGFSSEQALTLAGSYILNTFGGQKAKR